MEAVECGHALRVGHNNEVAILVVRILHADEHSLPENWGFDIIFKAGGKSTEGADWVGCKGLK